MAFQQLKKAVSGVIDAVSPLVKEKYSPAVYHKKEYFTVESPDKSYDEMWNSLPKVNPRVLLGGNGYTGLVDLELIRNTSASWDPRGEPDAVKDIQAVRVPGYLLNDRNLTAAQQRSWNREMQGDRQIQI